MPEVTYSISESLMLEIYKALKIIEKPTVEFNSDLTVMLKSAIELQSAIAKQTLEKLNFVH